MLRVADALRDRIVTGARHDTQVSLDNLNTVASRFPALTYLTLQHTALHADALRGLEALPSLTYLDLGCLEDDGLLDSQVRALSELTGLRMLELGGNMSLTDYGTTQSSPANPYALCAGGSGPCARAL